MTYYLYHKIFQAEPTYHESKLFTMRAFTIRATSLTIKWSCSKTTLRCQLGSGRGKGEFSF